MVRRGLGPQKDREIRSGIVGGALLIAIGKVIGPSKVYIRKESRGNDYEQVERADRV